MELNDVDMVLISSSDKNDTELWSFIMEVDWGKLIVIILGLGLIY